MMCSWWSLVGCFDSPLYTLRVGLHAPAPLKLTMLCILLQQMKREQNHLEVEGLKASAECFTVPSSP